MKSISAIARESAAKVTLRAMAISALVMTIVVVGTLAREMVESVDSIFHSIEMNLTQSIQLGDGFQTAKLIGSLVKGGGIQGVVVSDERMHAIAEAGTVTTDDDPLSLKFDHAVLSKRYPLKQQSGEMLGDILIQKRVPYTPLMYLVLSLVALTITIYAFTWHTVLTFSRRLIAPVEAIPELLFQGDASIGPADVLEIHQLQEHLKTLHANEHALREAKDDIHRKEKLLYLSAQVAHDIQSPLTTLDAFRADIKLDDPKKLRLVKDAISRIEEISEDLLSGEFIRSVTGKALPSCTRSSGLSLSVVSSKDLAAAIESLVTAKQHEVPGSKTIRMEFSADVSGPVQLRGDLAQIKRILSNILSNAIEAISVVGSVTTRIEAGETGLAIIVQDTGRGIVAENLSRLGKAPLSFDKANGHGLGLFHAFQTIKQYGGEIGVISSVGEGTTVKIALPLTQKNTRDAASANTFILIDDDPMVRETWDISAMVNRKIFRGFPDFESFAKEMDSFPKSATSIFVDENLGGGASGTSLVPQIRALGFQNVYLSTGTPGGADPSVVNYGKKPPWRVLDA